MSICPTLIGPRKLTGTIGVGHFGGKKGLLPDVAQSLEEFGMEDFAAVVHSYADHDEVEIDCAIFAGMLTEFCVATTYYAAAERGVFPFMGKDAMIPYNADGNKAAEIMCSMVTVETTERYLKGEQPEIVLGH